jgi:hypothetical protein
VYAAGAAPPLCQRRIAAIRAFLTGAEGNAFPSSFGTTDSKLCFEIDE